MASVAIKCGHQSQSQSFAFSLSFLPISACPKAKVEGPLWVAGYYSSRFDSSHYMARPKHLMAEILAIIIDYKLI